MVQSGGDRKSVSTHRGSEYWHIVWAKLVSIVVAKLRCNLAAIFILFSAEHCDKKWKLSWWNHCKLSHESVYWRWEGWALCLNQWHLFLRTIKLRVIIGPLSGRKSAWFHFILRFRDRSIQSQNQNVTGYGAYRGRRARSTQWSNWPRQRSFCGHQKDAIWVKCHWVRCGEFRSVRFGVT